MHDLIIIGAGPAGCAAAVYAARKRLKTLLITPDWGGQSIVSEDIQNWIGTVSVSGVQLAENLKRHVLASAGDAVEVRESESAKMIKKIDGGFSVRTEAEQEYRGKTVLVATGSHRRKLDIPGAKEFENKGISYCASCDGPVFADRDVAVIGGGNAGFETAAQLLAYAKSVTLLNRSKSYKADPGTVEKVLAHAKMKSVSDITLLEVAGKKFVSGVRYRENATQKIIELPIEGIFVEIGLVPSTDFVKDLVKLNAVGQIAIDQRTGRSSLLGIWAAGDCSDTLYHQNNIAAGDGVRALEDIYLYLHAAK